MFKMFIMCVQVTRALPARPEQAKADKRTHMFAHITVLHASAHMCMYVCVDASVCVCLNVLILVFAGSDIDAGCETSSPNKPQ